MTQSVKLGMNPRSSRTCCSPTHRVGMILPVDSVIVGPKTVSESQIPAACYLDSQSVSSRKPLAVIGVFLGGIGETVHWGLPLFLSLFHPHLTFLFLFGFDASSTALGGRPERQDFRVSPRDLLFQNRNQAALLFAL